MYLNKILYIWNVLDRPEVLSTKTEKNDSYINELAK